MAYAREIFIAIKQKIRFQQADKEADSHYTVLGNTLVRISNHCTWMKIWDNYLQKNPQDAKRNILSLVFEDGEDTYTEECLFTVTERKKPIRVTEYVFKSASLSKQDVKMIIGSLQQMMTTNKFNEPTGKGERFDRISVNPDYMNIETTADRRAIPAGGHGMDYSIEESKTNKNMKKNIVKINENTLRKMVAESVKKVVNEWRDLTASEIEWRDIERKRDDEKHAREMDDLTAKSKMAKKWFSKANNQHLNESGNDTDSEIYQAITTFLGEIHRIITTDREAVEYYGEEIRDVQQSAIRLRDALIHPTQRRMGVSQGDLTFDDLS